MARRVYAFCIRNDTCWPQELGFGSFFCEQPWPTYWIWTVQKLGPIVNRFSAPPLPIVHMILPRYIFGNDVRTSAEAEAIALEGGYQNLTVV